jgi:hypothetical protein
MVTDLFLVCSNYGRAVLRQKQTRQLSRGCDYSSEPLEQRFFPLRHVFAPFAAFIRIRFIRHDFSFESACAQLTDMMNRFPAIVGSLVLPSCSSIQNLWSGDTRVAADGIRDNFSTPGAEICFPFMFGRCCPWHTHVSSNTRRMNGKKTFSPPRKNCRGNISCRTPLCVSKRTIISWLHPCLSIHCLPLCFTQTNF